MVTPCPGFPPGGNRTVIWRNEISRSGAYCDLGLRHHHHHHLPAAVTQASAVKIEENKKNEILLAKRNLSRISHGWKSKHRNAKCPAPVRYGIASTRSRPNCCRDNRSSSSSSRPSHLRRCFLRDRRSAVPGGLHRRRRHSTLTGRSAAAVVDSVPDEDVPTWTSGYHRVAPGGPSRRCASSRSWRRAAC